MLDLSLAVLHHLLIFSIAAIIAAEATVLHWNVGSAQVRFLPRLDAHYGVMAGVVVIVGFARAIFAAKGWHYYSHNLFFWAKLATFALVGLLSIPPTLQFIAWRNADRATPGALPAESELARARRILRLEIVLFALLPVFAALMARGYGQLG